MQTPPTCKYKRDISRIPKLIMKNVVIDGVVVPEDSKKGNTSFTSKMKIFFQVKKSEEVTWSNRSMLSKSTGYASNLRRSRTTSKTDDFLRVLEMRPTSLPLEYEASISGHSSDQSYSSFTNFVLSRQNKE